MSLKIKVCGMRERMNVSEVAALSPDYMGFIFYPPSPRFCGDLDPDIVGGLPERVIPVAVVVNAEESEVMTLAERYGFRGVQLHGNESRELCRRLRDNGLYVIKAISVKDKGSLTVMKEYEDVVDLLVLDTATTAKGGSGRKFDWNLLAEADLHTDFLLSGGIGVDDADAILMLEHPHLVGVDLNSRFEISPGLKNVAALKSFVCRLNRDNELLNIKY